MPLDLKRINPGKGSKLLEPRDIFMALTDKPFDRLRPEQGEVLKVWFGRRTAKDLVIKQNTGGGKTLVGLLIGQSSMNEAVAPVVYLVPDTFLIKQVVDAAEEVGIPVTEEVNDDKFLSGHAILVATFDRLVNGRSRFGVRGYKPVTPLGTVIVDDAHTALANAQNQFCATVPDTCKAYKQLLELYSADLKRQSPKGYADLVEGVETAPIRVPPKAVAERADQALAILRPHGDDDSIKSLYFSWPLVADHLAMAVITFTAHRIEIKTPCPDIAMIPAFAQAPRRIYLTATLADEGVLVTQLGANAEDLAEPITPDRASDLGDRMILAPLSINPGLRRDSIQQMARDFADGDRMGAGSASSKPVNVVVLVPSEYKARSWAPYADETLTVKTMDPVIQKMTSGHHVGLVVLINKYDGVDLPNDACRLMIIDGVPTPLSASEQRESAALTGSMTFEARNVQRIEQGMGRGIRDLSDYCAVVLMTAETALTLRSPQQREFYSPATREQIDLSLKVAHQIENEGIEEIRNALHVFLERDDDWVTNSRAAIADVEYDRTASVSVMATARRRAFDKAVAGNYEAAVDCMRSGVDSVIDPIEKGWYMEEVATYQQLIDPMGAQKTLAGARDRNPGVVKPDVAPAPKPISGPALQAQAAAEYLASTYSDGSTLRLAVSTLFDNIVWGIENTAQLSEAQIQSLGQHLGFTSTRPEKETSDGGPDNLWALSRDTHAVIELKTEVDRNDRTIVKHEAGQLLTSVQWDAAHNPHVTKRIPVMLHPYTTLNGAASLPPETRIITAEDLDQLRASVETFAGELASTESWGDPKSVGEALRRNKLKAETIISTHSSKLT